MIAFSFVLFVLGSSAEKPTSRTIVMAAGNESETHVVWVAADKLTSFEFPESIDDVRCTIAGEDKEPRRRGDRELHLTDLHLKAGERGALSVRLRSGKKVLFDLKGTRFEDADWWVRLVRGEKKS